jgi:hypothetical protein
MAPANYHERQNRAPGKMLLHGKQLPSGVTVYCGEIAEKTARGSRAQGRIIDSPWRKRGKSAFRATLTVNS